MLVNNHFYKVKNYYKRQKTNKEQAITNNEDEFMLNYLNWELNHDIIYVEKSEVSGYGQLFPAEQSDWHEP